MFIMSAYQVVALDKSDTLVSGGQKGPQQEGSERLTTRISGCASEFVCWLVLDVDLTHDPAHVLSAEPIISVTNGCRRRIMKRAARSVLEIWS